MSHLYCILQCVMKSVLSSLLLLSFTGTAWANPVALNPSLPLMLQLAYVPSPRKTEDQSRALGRANKFGALRNAEKLPFFGLGYVKLHPWRNNRFGTRALVEMIERAASHMQIYSYLNPTVNPNTGEPVSPQLLPVGDLSSDEGGVLCHGEDKCHGSHENGTDADIGYFRTDYWLPDGERGKKELVDKKVTTQKTRSGKIKEKVEYVVSERFDVERNWELMKSLARNGDVSRIFVSPPIKQAFCTHVLDRARVTDAEHAELSFERELLRKVRADSIEKVGHHDDHFHVRIACPKNSLKNGFRRHALYRDKTEYGYCVDQYPPPPGTGC